MTPPASGPITRVPLVSRIGFGVGDFGFVLVWQGTALFLMYYYTDVLGIDPVTAGTIYLIAMIWDAITDPAIATLAERTRTRWGRYRPWIAIGAVPFGISYALAFSASPTSAIPVWAWALMTHLLLRSAYTAVSMPFNALQARLTPDADERSILAGFRMVGAASGGIGIVFLTPLIVGLWVAESGAGGEARGYFAAACMAGLLAMAGLMYCALTMREPEDTGNEAVSTSFLEDLSQLAIVFRKNGPLIRVFSVIVIGSICMGMFGKSVLYYFKYVAQRPELTMAALLLPAVLVVVTTPLWVLVSRKTSKRSTLMTGLAIALVGYVGFFAMPATSISLVFVTIAVIGIGTAALPVMFWAMVPDTIEYGEIQTGIRAEARTFGFATFAQKAAVGINALLFGALLSLSGFVANQPQADSTLTSLKAVMALIPAAGAIAILIIMRGYILDAKTHSAMLEKLRAIEHG